MIYSTTELANHVGVTQQRINQYVKEGLPKQDRNTFDLDACCKWIRRYEIIQIEKEYTEKADQADFWTEKTRLTKVQADIAQDKLLQDRGELIPVIDWQKLSSRILGAFRDNMLGLDRKLMHRIGLKHSQVVRNAIRQQLDQLSKGLKIK